MAIRVDGQDLTIDKVVDIARNKARIEIPDEAMERVAQCRKVVERMIEKREIMYGVTTGIGELAGVILTPEQTKKYQRYLVYSHAAGYGKPIAEENVRAAILSRINVLLHGHSGCRPIIVETLRELLNRGVTPVMCQKGSVGACGDLSPMGQMALVLLGEGEAFYKGERMSGKEAMDAAGIPTVQFEARDGLATINGSNVITGIGSLEIHDAERWLRTQEIISAMTLEVLNANMIAYDERIHKARGYPGAIAAAANIRKLTAGSDLLKQKGKKVQDAYSLRSTPQVVGAAKDAFKFAREMFLIELNGVGDNPLFFEEDGGVCLTGANFQGTPLAFGLEMLGTAVTTVCVLSERRINRLMNPHLSMGLPAFLTKGAGMFSGLMLTQYTAGSLCCENRVLSHPAATGSIPAAADQEDFVSMGMTSAIKARQILENANAVIAIELLAAAQAVDFRKPIAPGRATQLAYEVVRKYVKPLEEDRPLYDDINTLSAVVRSGEILKAVEDAIGDLE